MRGGECTWGFDNGVVRDSFPFLLVNGQTKSRQGRSLRFKLLKSVRLGKNMCLTVGNLFGS